MYIYNCSSFVIPRFQLVSERRFHGYGVDHTAEQTILQCETRSWGETLFIILCLRMPQLAVLSTLSQQFFMASLLYDTALVEYRDLIAESAGG